MDELSSRKRNILSFGVLTIVILESSYNYADNNKEMNSCDYSLWDLKLLFKPPQGIFSVDDECGATVSSEIVFE